MIKEIIIVEGKDDITKVKQALDADVIATGGIHISKPKMDEIVEITKTRGAIILTDPDSPGETIRRKLKENLKCPIKDAYINQRDGVKNGDVGIENASADVIRKAIELANPIVQTQEKIYDSKFLFEHGFTGLDNSKYLREKVSEKLGIGKPNAKEFINRLNSFAIEEEKILQAIKEVQAEGGK